MTDNSRQINAENRARHTRESDDVIVPLSLTCRCGYVAPNAEAYELHEADIMSCSEYRDGYSETARREMGGSMGRP